MSITETSTPEAGPASEATTLDGVLESVIGVKGEFSDGDAEPTSENPKAIAGETSAEEVEVATDDSSDDAAEGHEASEDEATPETDIPESEGEPAPDALAAPKTWPAEQREAFEQLPDEQRDFMLQRENERDAAFTRKTTELAEQRKQVEGLQGVLAPYKQQMQAHGISEAEYISRLMSYDNALRQNPQAAIAHLAQHYGVQLPSGDSGADYVEDYSTDSHTQQLQQQLAQTQQQVNMLAQSQHQDRYKQLEDQVSLFANEKSADGSLKRPHFDKLRERMSRLVTAGETQDLQTAANDIANQRSDNVQLVLNKRYHIRRSANIDINALKRSVPGGSVMMDDPVQDVQIVNTPDVTASSYEEQDRLNVDFDDIAGTFSQATVQTNRNMNETVGGMEMLSSDANAQIEYMIRTFAETWVEPVLRQMIRLEQYYETDDVILEVAVNKAAEEGGIGAEIFQRFMGDDADELLRNEMTIGVNVGIGATDPVKKIERLLIGIRTLGDVNPDIIAYLNQNEITKEVFGALGYKDSTRFIEEKEGTMLGEMQGRLDQMEQAVQALADKGAKAEIDAQSRVLAAQIKGQAEVMAAKEKALGDVQSTMINTDGRDRSDALRHQIALIDTRLKAEKNDIERGELLLQKESLVHKMLMETEPDIGIDPEGKKMSEVLQNDQFGKIQGAEG